MCARGLEGERVFHLSALHVGLVVTPPLGLLWRRVARHLFEEAANAFVVQVAARKLRHPLDRRLAQLRGSAIEDVAHVDFARRLREHHDPFVMRLGVQDALRFLHELDIESVLGSA